MREVSVVLVKKKIHDATKFVAPVRQTAPVQFLYLQPNAVRQLGNPSMIEVVIRSVQDKLPNAVPTANGADHAGRTTRSATSAD